MASISEGLYVCSDLKKGERLVRKGLSSPECEAFLSSCFEVGRRFKIMNPAKMRGTYGKMMYMLQDAMPRHAQESLGLRLWKPLNMVATFLEAKGALELLFDANVKVATMDVPAAAPDGSPRPRAEIDAAVGAKRAAEAALVARFGSGPGAPLTASEVARVVASVGDAEAYAAANERPVEKMLQLLTDNFSPVGKKKNTF